MQSCPVVNGFIAVFIRWVQVANFFLSLEATPASCSTSCDKRLDTYDAMLYRNPSIEVAISSNIFPVFIPSLPSILPKFLWKLLLAR